MKNGHSRGDVITFTAPSGGVTSGVPIIIGALFVIPAISAAEGESFEGAITQAWNLPKVPANTTTVGAAAYWNATAGQATTTATGNRLIGAFIEAKANGDSTAAVVLNGIAVV
ncbi:hypothetical protein [Pseudoalteromonas phage B8b]|uniref:DUF2190 family protein n=1 Tax=Pseudoalteromonas phage B8b TaxID=1506997 RepID=A0A076G9K1_9CAUD|nr:hypothetical protein [Pseudoalteromonas phage B8b]